MSLKFVFGFLLVFFFANPILARKPTALRFVTSNVVVPPSVLLGQNLNVSFSLTSNLAASGIRVQANLVNSVGTRVAYQEFTSQIFTANVAKAYSASLVIPSTLAAGTYTMRIRVLNSTGSVSYLSAALGSVQLQSSTVTPPPPTNSDGGTAISAQITYYWTVYPSDADLTTAPTPIYDVNNQLIATIPLDLVEMIVMEGSGFIPDGRLINVACACAWPTTRFEVVDQSIAPYGLDARGQPLVPYKTIAVDRNKIPLGTKVFIRELKGKLMPDGTLHNGCTVAGDVGAAITGTRIDFYTRSYGDWLKIYPQLPSTVNITPNSTNCQ